MLREWAERLSAATPLLGTKWDGVDSDKTKKKMTFLPKTKSWSNKQAKDPLAPWGLSKAFTHRLLSYANNTSTYANAAWRQIGPVVQMGFNQGYAHYVGVIFNRDRLYGTAHNKNDHKWTWRVGLTDPDDE